MTHLANSLSFRPFRLADAGAIEPWLSAPGLSMPMGSARRDWPMRVLADGRILLQVALSGDLPIGLVRLDCGPDLVAEITIVVAPESRRRGHGRAILGRAIVQARDLGLQKLVACIDRGNTAALEFFQEMRFRQSGLVANRLRLVRELQARVDRPPLEIEL